MGLKRRLKRSTEFSMASMSDIVFLLLIFFMLTSTLVSPNAIKLLLPASTSDRTFDPNIKRLQVYIDQNIRFYVGVRAVEPQMLRDVIAAELHGATESTVELRADASVPVQEIVYVIDQVNMINKQLNTRHRVILATKPK